MTKLELLAIILAALLFQVTVGIGVAIKLRRRLGLPPIPALLEPVAARSSLAWLGRGRY
ncbi:MAG: hypothetical protein WCP77_06850 [Roseococcus sp.]